MPVTTVPTGASRAPVATYTTPVVTTVPVTPAASAPKTTGASPSGSVPPTTVPVAARVPKPPSFDSSCRRPATPALQTYLDALPPGSVFQSPATACYLVPDGILLTHPVTIIGGTFYDPLTQRPTDQIPYGALKPVILIKDTSHVALVGVHVRGANVVGGYHASLVGEAGVKIMSSSGVTLTDVTATNTFGDGLELVADLTDHIKTPVTGLEVDGYTTVNAGRQGVTVAEVADSTLDHVNVVSPADAGFDFESDLPGVGSGNVTITNCTDTGGFNLVEDLVGPITVSNCTGFHHIGIRSLQSDTPIRFVGGTLSCKRDDPNPCIDQTGGSLTLSSVAVTRMPGTIGIKEPVWSVADGGALRFVHSAIAFPMGTVDRSSSLTFAQ